MDFYVVCHAYIDAEHGTSPFNHVFENKFLRRGAAALNEDQQQTQWLHEDFDPEYGLRGERARSVLDWERIAMKQVAKSYPGQRIRFIDERGGQYRKKPDWYAPPPRLHR